MVYTVLAKKKKKRESQTRRIDIKIQDIFKFTSEITGVLFDDSDKQIFQTDHCIRECKYFIWTNTAVEVPFCGKYGDFFHPYLMAQEF